MKRKILLLNDISGVFFFISSASLIGIPFLDSCNGFSIAAYFFAGLFWIGLLIGIGLQFIISFISKKMSIKEERTHKKRKMLVPVAVFLVLFALIMCFLKKSVALISIDIALLLFSIEIYFYMKRRNSV